MNEVAARFELRERLGSTATTDVYRALDHKLGADVVLWLVRADVVDDEYVERFHREAEAASDIRHPNVVGVLEHGAIEGRAFVTRELVHGSTLEDVVARRGPLPQDEARSIAEQAARGVAAAHARGVLHRDVNARSVFLTTDGSAKVVDFGTPSTPRHPAPEQTEGGTIDERADVYGIGAVLYQMLTGQIPRGRPVPPRRLVKRVIGPLDVIAMRALEHDPARRYASAAAMADALRAPAAAAIRPRPLLVPKAMSRSARTERITRPVRAARSAPAPRSVAALGLALLALPMLLAAAVGAFASPRPGTTDRAVLSATTTPLPTSTPEVSALPSPETALIPPVETTPEPTPAPTPEPAAPIAPVAANTAAGTVRSFYELIDEHRFDDAATLWSPRMQANYPPSTNIYGRFDRTRQIVVRGISPVPQTGGGAAVSIDILEVLDSGVTRRWVGQWYLVWDGSRWVMDAPSLRAG